MGYKFTKEQTNEIIKAYVKNFESALNISKKFDCDSTVIKRILKENNVKVISGSAFSVKYWINRGMSEKNAEIKIKKMKPLYFEYWINKGYTREEAIIEMNKMKPNNELYFTNKFGTDGKVLYRKAKKDHGINHSVRRYEYWINKGYTKEEADIKISNIQTTFTLDKCIEKYGEKRGIEVYNNRQKRWVEKIQNKENIDEINAKKASKTINFFKEKFGVNWVNEICNHFFKNDTIIIDILNFYLKCKDIIKTVKYIKKKYEYNNKLINRIIYSKVILDVLNTSTDNLKKLLVIEYDINFNTNFGIIRTINGEIVKSNGEYKIYKFLLDNGIDFIYDKQYPFKSRKKIRYDFYLKEKKYYIEYCGLLTDVKSKFPDQDEIFKSYKRKIALKKRLCVKNNINYFFSNDVLKIIKFIKQIYDK